MDIKAALSVMSRDDFVQWIAKPDGWDRWASVIILTEDGPQSITIGVHGAMGAVLTEAGMAIHPHADQAEAISCWERLALRLRASAIMSHPASMWDMISEGVVSMPAALPASTDDVTVSGFGWS